MDEKDRTDQRGRSVRAGTLRGRLRLRPARLARRTLLRDITELNSLGAYIRLAPSKPAAAEQLRHRIRSLQTGDKAAVWQAIA
ncbi:hypothetical protein ABTW96_03535 [Nocardia beijingensis]|uniref:hypothetical protein n=1 Tax=Nocardia beijingensis TaxID=95162 RepID=UPI0033229871